jgi:VanZ family protein
MLKWPKSWKWWYRRALPVYWILLFCATHYPKLPSVVSVPQSDKVAHFVAFGLLAFLLWKYVESRGRRTTGFFVWMAFVVLTAYAALDEYLQRFVNRSVSLADWIANVAGIVAVLLVLELRRRWRASHPDENPDRSGS